MKIISYYSLHYGREYLHWSMRSIRDFVDDIVVLYSDKPSYGFKTNIPCPETRAELKNIADQFGAKWYDYNSHGHEGNHRDAAVDICEALGADVILPIDHDELWDPDHLHNILLRVMQSGAKDFRVPMQHYWRSFDWVCRDPLQPVRVIKPSGVGEEYISPGYGYMHHFGYAQSPLITAYKWQIHGHQNELRPGWFDNVFMKWRPGQMDVHPTNANFWTAASMDKAEIEHLIGDHPYHGRTVITDDLVWELDVGNKSPVPARNIERFGS